MTAAIHTDVKLLSISLLCFYRQTYIYICTKNHLTEIFAHCHNNGCLPISLVFSIAHVEIITTLYNFNICVSARVTDLLQISALFGGKNISFKVTYNILVQELCFSVFTVWTELPLGTRSVHSSFGQCVFSLLSWLIFEGHTPSPFRSFSITAVVRAEFFLVLYHLIFLFVHSAS